jgi:hypothetical protein
LPSRTVGRDGIPLDRSQPAEAIDAGSLDPCSRDVLRALGYLDGDQ